MVETSANDTADLALDLGTLGPTHRAEAVGTIGGTSGNADVDWFQYSLDRGWAKATRRPRCRSMSNAWGLVTS